MGVFYFVFSEDTTIISSLALSARLNLVLHKAFAIQREVYCSSV